MLKETEVKRVDNMPEQRKKMIELQGDLDS